MRRLFPSILFIFNLFFYSNTGMSCCCWGRPDVTEGAELERSGEGASSRRSYRVVVDGAASGSIEFDSPRGSERSLSRSRSGDSRASQYSSSGSIVSDSPRGSEGSSPRNREDLPPACKECLALRGQLIEFLPSVQEILTIFIVEDLSVYDYSGKDEENEDERKEDSSIENPKEYLSIWKEHVLQMGKTIDTLFDPLFQEGQSSKRSDDLIVPVKDGSDMEAPEENVKERVMFLIEILGSYATHSDKVSQYYCLLDNYISAHITPYEPQDIHSFAPD